MKNFILQNENAIYFECKFSCDNVIFLNLGDEKYFITDARYITEALESLKFEYNLATQPKKVLLNLHKLVTKLI